MTAILKSSAPTDVLTRPVPAREAPPRGSTVAPRTVAAVTSPVLLRVVRSELIKALSLRSMVIALGVTVFLVLALGTVMTIGALTGTLPADDGAGAAALDAAMGGIGVAMYAVAAFGVLAVTGEYATGTVRSTLAAVPRRGVLVAAKAIAVATATLAVALPTTLVMSAVTHVMLTAGDAATLPPLDTLRVAVGAALYLTVVALVGSGFGWLLRSTAGALAALVGLVSIAPVFAQLLPAETAAQVAPFLPDAGIAVYQSAPAIGPWAGLAVFVIYALAVLGAGALRLRRRDA